MKLIDILPPKDIFDPDVFYPGEIEIGDRSDIRILDEISLNAKELKNKNLYEDFIEKKFYRKACPLNIKGEYEYGMWPSFRLGIDAESKKRHFRFSFAKYLYQRVDNVNIYKEDLERFAFSYEENATNDELLNIAKEIMRKSRNVLDNYLTYKTKSPYYLAIQEAFDIEEANSSMVLNIIKNEITNFLVKAKGYQKIFEEDISFDEFLENIDYDKFCLVIIHSIIRSKFLKEDPDNLFMDLVSHYFEKVNILKRTNPFYNPKITIVNHENGKYKTIDYKEIEKMYQELLAKYPEFDIKYMDLNSAKRILTIAGLSEEEINQVDLQTADGYYLIKDLQEQIKSEEALMAEWEFIPKGENLDEPRVKGITHEHKEKTNNTDRFVISSEFLENSNYLYKLLGKDKMQGYIAYIYPNGKVIFEKSLTDQKRIDNSATYIMNYQNFRDLSKLSKREIIEIILNDKEDVARAYHYSDMDRWINKIKRVIAGANYTPEIINYFKRLIANHELSKARVKND